MSEADRLQSALAALLGHFGIPSTDLHRLRKADRSELNEFASTVAGIIMGEDEESDICTCESCMPSVAMH